MPLSAVPHLACARRNKADLSKETGQEYLVSRSGETQVAVARCSFDQARYYIQRLFHYLKVMMLANVVGIGHG